VGYGAKDEFNGLNDLVNGNFSNVEATTMVLAMLWFPLIV